MGAASERIKRFKAAQPFCVYCGGTTEGNTVDHMPSRALFDGRHRPKGLEFLACEACNSGTRNSESIVALVSRVYPDTEDDDLRKELARILRGVEANNPGLLRSMRASFRQEKVVRKASGGKLHALNMDQPQIHAAVRQFGAKLGLALHYELTTRIVPATGGVAVFWFSNYDAVKGRLPGNLIELCGDPRTLAQGRFSVGGQFTYASKATDDKTVSAHFATFRLSFSMVMFVAEDIAALGPDRMDQIFRPGCCKATP
jgi:hypothetical protein